MNTIKSHAFGFGESQISLDLGHAEVVFALVVGERDDGIGHEEQGCGLEVPETFEKVAGFRLGGAAALAIVRSPGAFGFAAFDDAAVTAAEGLRGGVNETTTGFAGPDIDFEQERVHVEAQR